MRIALRGGWAPAIFAVAIAACAPSLVGVAQARSYVEEAQQYLQKGDFKSALIQLRNAVRQSPGDPRIRAQLADALLRTGDFEAALREARAAQARNGDEADYLPVLADALLGQGKFADLLREVTPGDRAGAIESRIRVAIGTAELSLHRRQKAELAFRDAVRLDPQSTWAKLVLARFLTTKDPGEADRITDELLAADPRLADAIQLKGAALQARGDREGAMRRFDEAINLDPRNRLARLSRAALSIQDRNSAAADQDLNPILQANPNDVQANFLRARLLASQKQYAKADELLQRLSPAFETFWDGYYLQGAVKFELGQYAQAETLLTKYIGRMPQDDKAIRLAAMLALRRGNPPKAIEYLKPLADKALDDAATLGLLGNAYLAAGKTDLALEQFNRAVAIDPENPRFQTSAALAEMRTGKSREGLADLERVFETAAGVEVAGPPLVLAALRSGQIETAAAAAVKLVDRNPKNPAYQTLLGMVRARQGDIAGAEKAFRTAAALQPDSGTAVAHLARLYAATGRTEEAIKELQNLLAKNSNDVTALRGLAQIATSQQKWNEAATYLNQAQTAAPNDPSSGIDLVNLYLGRGEAERAKGVADLLAAQFTASAAVLDALARTQIALRENSSATATYQRAYRLAPNSPLIISRYVAALLTAKNFSEARSVLQEAVDRNPANTNLKIDLLRVEARINLDGAVTKARTFAKAEPNSPRYDLVAADLYEGAGRNSEAQQILEKLADADASNNDLGAALANFYSRRGEYAKSEALLKRKLAADPESVVLHFTLGSMYLNQRKLNDAVREYERVLAVNPKHVPALNNIAWLFQQQGDLAKARELAEQAVAAAPNAADVQDTLGWILLAQGETEKALTHLKAASLAMPQNPIVQYHWAVALNRSGRSADARTVLENLLASGSEFENKADAEKLLMQLKSG